MLLCVRIRVGMAYTKNASPFFVAYMNVLAPMNKGLKCLDFSLPSIFSFTFQFLHALIISCYVSTCRIMFKVQRSCWKRFVFWCKFVY